MFRAQRRHRADGSVRRPLLSISNLIKTVGALSVAVVLGVLASGGTFAYLSSSASASTGTISAGNAALSTSGSPLSLAGLYPGATVSAPFTVSIPDTGTDAAQGTVPLALSVTSFAGPATSNALWQNLSIRVDVTTSAASCLDGTGLSGTPTWQPSSTGTSLNSTLAVGANAIVCLSATLSPSAPSSALGQTTSFNVTIGGVQS